MTLLAPTKKKIMYIEIKIEEENIMMSYNK